jgi:hypothetical protein
VSMADRAVANTAAGMAAPCLEIYAAEAKHYRSLDIS